MKLFPVEDFAYRGSVQLPNGEWRACGIAPSSMVDICSVSGFALGPGTLVPCRGGDTVSAIRGWRSGRLETADTEAEQASNVRNLSSLVLVLYESCDDLIPPGPRAIYRTGGLYEMGLTSRLVARVPFSGRKQAIVAFRGEDGVTTDDMNCIVRGVRYLPREFLMQHRDDSEDYQPYYEEATAETLFNGGASVPESTVDDDAGSPPTLGRIVNVGGGGDNQEGFDELEVWLKPPGGGGAGAVFVDVEVSGERG